MEDYEYYAVDDYDPFQDKEITDLLTKLNIVSGIRNYVFTDNHYIIPPQDRKYVDRLRAEFMPYKIYPSGTRFYPR